MSELLFVLAMGGFPLGLALGAYMEARNWRAKGDHEYMNLKESGGSLYIVERQMDDQHKARKVAK